MAKSQPGTHDLRVVQPWQSCFKIMPYRDVNGRFVVPGYHGGGTECRQVKVDGRLFWQYRARAETRDEWDARQW